MLGVKTPKKECEDEDCPFHGTLSVRGQIIEGEVVDDKMDKTVVVERNYAKRIPKYERYERRTSKLLVHNPPCIDAREGDTVKIGECRKLSKQKSFVVLEREEAE
ncbi:MAG: 30S ribosomal protein S17 [Candidatus Hadarchaeia archaeon]